MLFGINSKAGSHSFPILLFHIYKYISHLKQWQPTAKPIYSHRLCLTKAGAAIMLR